MYHHRRNHLLIAENVNFGVFLEQIIHRKLFLSLDQLTLNGYRIIPRWTNNLFHEIRNSLQPCVEHAIGLYIQNDDLPPVQCDIKYPLNIDKHPIVLLLLLLCALMNGTQDLKCHSSIEFSIRIHLDCGFKLILILLNLI